MSAGAVETRHRRTLVYLLALTALAALLRLYQLGAESLWMDEAATWWNATRPTWHDTVFAESNHSPLWWVWTRLFVGAIGESEFALRLPAALWGMASVTLTYFLARALLDPARVPAAAGFRGVDAGAVWWVTLLAAIHPYWIEYAQEARMYAALLAETLTLSILYLSWLERRGVARMLLYGVVAATALYTHPFAALTLASHAVFALVLFLRSPARRAPPWPLLLAQLGAALAYLPWVLRSASLGAGVGSQGHFSPWQRALFALWRLFYGPSLAAADRPRIDAGLLALVRQEGWILGAGAVVGAVVVFFGMRALRRDPPALTFVLTSILLPFLVLVTVHARLPLLHERYLIMVAPFLLILAVVGARATPARSRPLAMLALVTMIGLGTLAYVAPGVSVIDRWLVHGHPRGKEQWREAQDWVAQRADRRSIVVLYPSYLETVWEYYDRHRLTTVGIERDPGSPLAQLEAAPTWTSATRVLLVSAGTRAEERDSVARRIAGWMATDSLSAVRGGWVEGRLFPRQWGVWTYDFVRGRPPARMPE